jgi:hypothetical protein
MARSSLTLPLSCSLCSLCCLGTSIAAMTLLLNNHGVVCCGVTIQEALRNIWVFTKAAMCVPYFPPCTVFTAPSYFFKKPTQRLQCACRTTTPSPDHSPVQTLSNNCYSLELFVVQLCIRTTPTCSTPYKNCDSLEHFFVKVVRDVLRGEFSSS